MKVGLFMLKKFLAVLALSGMIVLAGTTSAAEATIENSATFIKL